MSQFTVRPEPFYNRHNELDALERAWNRPMPSGQMALLYGRRRLGKTYLLQRFFAGGSSGSNAPDTPRPHCYYLADQTTSGTQRAEFAAQLLEAQPDPGVPAGEISVSWNALLRYASQAARVQAARTGERFGVVLDEFPYLVEQSPELPSVLQAWWDREGLHSPLFLVLCGSQLSAMAALGEENQPLYGRFNSGILLLPPLLYDEVSAFYAGHPRYGIPERLTMYGILGGTPRYHALVDPTRPMAEQVVDILLRPQGPLSSEVQFLLGSQQIREVAPYNAVLGAIATGTTRYSNILDTAGVERGSLPNILRSLGELGWIRRERPFGEASDRRALYRVADPFLAFWYRFAGPLASALQFSDPALVYEERIAPHLPDYMGWHVFEEVCHQWLRRRGRARLGLTVLEAGRYWSRDGKVEIDIMASLKSGYFLFGECKWGGRGTVGMGVYNSLLGKVAQLPRDYYRRDAHYVLFSAAGFAPELEIIAGNPANQLTLVGPQDLLPELS